MATDSSASAASEIEVGSIYPTMLELRAAAAKLVDSACVARVVRCGTMGMTLFRVVPIGVGCGGGLPVRRHSYRGIGWNYGASMMG